MLDVDEAEIEVEKADRAGLAAERVIEGIAPIRPRKFT
jgi:hypothetical protein